MTRRDFTLALAAVSAGASLNLSSLFAQGELRLEPITGNLSVLMGAGGNIAVLTGPDGLLLVDSGLPQAAEGMEAKARSVSHLPVKVLVNTHFHSDHTGGNELLGSHGAKIVAQDNVKQRLSTNQHSGFLKRDTPALKAVGLPVETFSSKGKLAFGGDTLHYQYLPPAHTDGDTVIHFEKAEVFHTGDLLFNGLYPFIDYDAGGSIEGMIANAQRMQKMVSASMKVIPGHGPICGRAELKEFHDMLATVNESISKLVKEGKTLEETQAAQPTKAYDEKWGKQFLSPAEFQRLIYSGKTRKA